MRIPFVSVDKKERRVSLAPGVIPGPSSGLRRVGKGAGGQIFRETFSGLKGWKQRIFFLDRRAIPDAMAWRHHDSDINDPALEDGFSAQDVQTLTERVIDLRPIPSGLLFQGGLATTWDFPGFHLIFKDTKGNDKTGNQRRVEVEDPKIVATRERKTRATAKKKEKRRHGDDDGEGSLPNTKRKKTIAHKDGPSTSEATSSPVPLRTIIPTNPTSVNPSGAAVATAESREDRSLHIFLHDSANHSVHRYTNGHDDNKETSSLRLGSFVDQSGGNLNILHTEVFQPSPGNQSAHPSPKEERRTSLVRSPLQGTHAEEGDSLVETHSACEDTVGQLVQARLDLTYNSHLYTTLSDRYKVVRSEHEGCTEKLEVLEKQNSELSQVNKDQALRIKELEDELARKDSALVYSKRINAKKAQEKEKLIAQLSKTEMDNFDCIRKFLPVVVNRLLQSHEYKESLSVPFNLAIQADWAKGLAEERSEGDLLELMMRMGNFDAYADKTVYAEYDKLFEKRYPFVEKISHGFRHTVSDLLKIYPDSPPHGQAPPSKPSSGKSPSSSAHTKP
ncbi:hypothetical protein Tco_0432620 [Tanacetum coccineum]